MPAEANIKELVLERRLQDEWRNNYQRCLERRKDADYRDKMMDQNKEITDYFVTLQAEYICLWRKDEIKLSFRRCLMKRNISMIMER